MNADFPRLITLLRKEKGISQKKAAGELGISQALLSHYEKGIRECGLDFLVRCAKFYDVSTDYLLGVSPDRHGNELTADNITDPDSVKDVVFFGNVMPVLNKKLIEEAGRLNVPGRPIQYRTTPDFLRTFGLSSLEELPPIEKISFGEPIEAVTEEAPSAEVN